MSNLKLWLRPYVPISHDMNFIDIECFNELLILKQYPECKHLKFTFDSVYYIHTFILISITFGH